MAAKSVYILESVNLICGDLGNEQQPGISTHLTLRELKLPGLEENLMDHVPGGASVGIEVPSHINRLEATFNLGGWQPEVMTLVARGLRELQSYTAYGVIRDQRSGRPLKGQAVMWGRMTRVNPTNWRKGDLQQHEFSIRSITHYELYMQRPGSSGQASLQEVYFWDFFESAFRVDAIDLRREENNILAIGTVI